MDELRRRIEQVGAQFQNYNLPSRVIWLMTAGKHYSEKVFKKIKKYYLFGYYKIVIAKSHSTDNRWIIIRL